MKNKKTILGSSAAIVAAAALITGGTFAEWSDFATYDNAVGADHLVLDVDSSGTLGFEQGQMAPGVNREFDFVVASRDGDVVPDAALALAFIDALGEEDGCTSNSEQAADNCFSGDEGDFIDQAYISINASAPTTDLANACDSSLHPRGQRLSTQSLSSAFGAGSIDLLDGATLKAGEGICVGMGITLPSEEHPSLPAADDKSQGDSAKWTFRYDLTQVSTGPGVY